MNTATYDMVWAALEQWHGMQPGDCGKARLFIISLVSNPFPNADAVQAVRDFEAACIEHGVAFDFDYEV